MTAEPSLTLWVPTDGNAVLEERFLRSLRADLAELEGVDPEITSDPAPAPTSAKAGSVLGEVALGVVLGTTTGKAAVSVLLESIRAWSAKQHDRIVHVRMEDGSEYRIPPDMDEAQQHLVERLLESDDS